jgi:hypothetical protein
MNIKIRVASQASAGRMCDWLVLQETPNKDKHTHTPMASICGRRQILLWRKLILWPARLRHLVVGRVPMDVRSNTVPSSVYCLRYFLLQSRWIHRETYRIKHQCRPLSIQRRRQYVYPKCWCPSTVQCMVIGC